MSNTNLSPDAPEEWRAVPEFEGYYEASTLGRVRSVKRVVKSERMTQCFSGRVLSAVVSNKGYPMVSMWRDGKRLTATVHKIVLLTFRGPRPPGAIIRHLNGDALDSRLENLAYGTPRQNNLDKVVHGTDHNVNKTHCPYDHPLFGDNLYIKPNGCRSCKTCRLEASRRQRSRQIEARQVAAATVVFDPAEFLETLAETAKHVGLVGEAI